MSVLPRYIPNGLMTRLWSWRRALGLSPTQKVFREIARRGVPLSEMSAVEVFAGTGFRHSMDYVNLVRKLEAWEVNPVHEAALRRNLPGATIRITDSFDEVRTTAARFGIIVVDNTITTFGNGYIEHLDLFPAIFRIAEDDCVFVLNVCPVVPPHLSADAVRLSRRAAFYATDRPDSVPIAKMAETYERLMKANGFAAEWWFQRKRAYREGIHYLVMRMRRVGSSPARAS